MMESGEGGVKKKTEGNSEERAKAKIKEEVVRVGIKGGDVAGEVLRMLPESFVLQYELLWLRGLKGGVAGPAGGDPDAAVDVARRVTRTSTSQVETRGAAKSGGKRQGVSGRTLFGDLRAVAYRARIDRKLRALARDMIAWADGDRAGGVRRCVKCRVWTEDGWNYCPRDGARTEEVDV